MQSDSRPCPDHGPGQMVLLSSEGPPWHHCQLFRCQSPGCNRGLKVTRRQTENCCSIRAEPLLVFASGRTAPDPDRRLIVHGLEFPLSRVG